MWFLGIEWGLIGRKYNEGRGGDFGWIRGRTWLALFRFGVGNYVGLGVVLGGVRVVVK